MTKNDLKRLEDLINNHFDPLEKGQKALEKASISGLVGWVIRGRKLKP
ncbi:hypothetical protein [Crocosphaera sp.]|nr:hypothetical protein [Crocosphaera sp.]MDJ0581440.1 hypothetical protein [Crocosphaera sp.]